MGILGQRNIDDLVDAVNGAQLSVRRSALVAGIDPQIVASIQVVPRPADQLLLDVNELNARDYLDGDMAPLARYIRSAIKLTDMPKPRQTLERLLSIVDERYPPVPPPPRPSPEPTPSRPSMEPRSVSRKIFVIHGRNLAARDALWTFLRSLHLEPFGFEQMAAKVPGVEPTVGDIIRAGAESAPVVVVLFTPDEIASLRPEHRDSGEERPHVTRRWQASPDVIFQAGVAYAHAAKRIVLVRIGEAPAFSNLSEDHFVRLSNEFESRRKLRAKLETIYQRLDDDDEGWRDKQSGGDFDTCVQAMALFDPWQRARSSTLLASKQRVAILHGGLVLAGLLGIAVVIVKLRAPTSDMIASSLAASSSASSSASAAPSTKQSANPGSSVSIGPGRKIDPPASARAVSAVAAPSAPSALGSAREPDHPPSSF